MKAMTELQKEQVKVMLQQFGGGRSMMMIGGQASMGVTSHKEVYDGDKEWDMPYLNIRFKSGSKNKANIVQILLDEGQDMYVMRFRRIWGSTLTEIETIPGLFHDQLMDIFEERTAVYLRL